MIRCGNHCGKPECLALCKKHDWFACEYQEDNRNCVAIIVPIDPLEPFKSTNIPPHNKEVGFCYVNRNKIPFKFL